MTEPVLLFLDINGVIDVKDNTKTTEEKISNQEIGYPVPGAKEFLQLIDNCSWIHPLWISSWGCQSYVWNKWSNTRYWDSAYPLNEDEENKALRLFPNASDKYLAARWHSRDWQHRVVWIEDGFWLMSTSPTLEWTQSNPKIQIIDTLPTPKEHLQGYEQGIEHWNIERICDALDIEKREILLNQIKVYLPDLTETLSQNIISVPEENPTTILNQINPLPADKNTKNLKKPTSFISNIWNLFKESDRT
ncbi:hypothetical protein WA1_19400 [Scytonema hofmannii PCC 7110]|uniref:Uncharacterized protein n=1 Tax=Scytonema hofmannii PCC 7110 TaxID=128403 RepID=A0A139XBU1_9CYAN|nr:hypothetical protein [Scytonema hofmannii]KYC42159.1 hypothetical protein WA1_19400 [Scytonema hofmannii PCC 7110]